MILEYAVGGTLFEQIKKAGGKLDENLTARVNIVLKILKFLKLMLNLTKTKVYILLQV